MAGRAGASYYRALHSWMGYVCMDCEFTLLTCFLFQTPRPTMKRRLSHQLMNPVYIARQQGCCAPATVHSLVSASQGNSTMHNFPRSFKWFADAHCPTPHSAEAPFHGVLTFPTMKVMQRVQLIQADHPLLGVHIHSYYPPFLEPSRRFFS